MKYCTQCGTSCEDSAKFCTECGAPLTQTETTATDSTLSYSYESKTNQNTDSNHTTANTAKSYTGITERSIPVALILSIVTCGLYGIYWMIKLNDEVNILSGEPNATSGGMVFLLSFITCGIYGIYWLYKMGERCDRIKNAEGNSPIIYLILGLLGFSIISYCLIQDTINKAI